MARPQEGPTVVTCRCEVLNNLTGDAAVEYARRHLDKTRSEPQGRVHYRCVETGIGWIEEPAPNGYGDSQRRLRRASRT